MLLQETVPFDFTNHSTGSNSWHAAVSGDGRPHPLPCGETNLGNPTSKSEIVLGGTPQSATGLQLLSLEPQTCSARVVEWTRERKGARSLVLFIGMLGVRGTGGFCEVMG